MKGFGWNHKRVYRNYCNLALNLRIKPKRRLKRDTLATLAVRDVINDVWSMDFMYAELYDGLSFRTFNVINDFNRESLAVEVGMSLCRPCVLSESSIRSLNGAGSATASPKQSVAIMAGVYQPCFRVLGAKSDINLMLIQPGNPQQNAYVECYNPTVRYDLLNQHMFASIEVVQLSATRWLWTYNDERPSASKCHWFGNRDARP